MNDLIANDWEDVQEILYFGSKEDILNLKCPDCGHEIEFVATPIYNSIQIKCEGCGVINLAHKVPDNLSCVKYFGESFKIPLKNQKKTKVG